MLKNVTTIRKYFWIAIILVVTSLVYSSSISNGFTPGMDDDMYILDNELLKSLNIFDHGSQFIAGNYHPLTTLSYALEHYFFGVNSTVFHITNLLLHLLNTLLAFLFISSLLQNHFAGITVAAIFALHPMHVESVAWISERKDQLYTLFYLIALLSYVKFNTTNQIKYLSSAGVAMVLSLLSKSMAVTLPLMFIAIDFYLGKKINPAYWVKRTPFFVLSLIFGLIAMESQSSGNTFYELSLNYSLYDRIAISSYSVVFYLLKFALPINLSVYHFYPNSLSTTQLISPLILIATGILLWKNRKTEFGKNAILAISIFIVSLLPVLQIVPVGRAFAAERYTYVAYIGLGLLLFFTLDLLLKSRKIKPFVLAGFVALISWFSFLSYSRISVWESSETLFTDLVEKQPESEFGFYSRGVVYDESNRLDLALEDYNRSIALNPNFYKSFNNRAVVRGKKGNLKGALHDCNKSIMLNPAFASAYNNRGNAKSGLGDHAGAIADCSEAIKINPAFVGAYNNRASAYLVLGQFDNALSDFIKLLEFKPNAADALQGAGASYQGLKEYEKSIEFFDKSLNAQPNNYIALFGRAASKFYLKNFNGAIADYKAVIKFNPEYADAYVNQGMSYFKLNNQVEACKSWIIAKEKGATNVDSFIATYCN